MTNIEKSWWKEAIGYQIYPKTFFDYNQDGIGDIRGIIEKLDYLQDLGVDCLWICPFFQSPMDDNGYDISDYFALNPQFGTIKDVVELIQQAHQRNLHIILDLVLNHTSDEHPWFVEARQSREAKTHDYYIWQEAKFDNQGHRCPPTNWSSFFSDSAWAYNEATDEYYMKIFSKKMPDLNWANPQLRSKMEEVARWWLDLGIDGFRMDAIAHLARDTSYQDSDVALDAQGNAPDWSKFSNLPALFDYLKQFKEEVLDHYPCLTVGEVGGKASPQMALKYAGYKEGAMNMVFTFDHCWCNNLNGKETQQQAQRIVDVVELKQVFQSWYQGLNGKAWPAVYWMNHDQPRVVSQYGDTGSYWKQSAKMLCTTLYLMYGTPFVYNGEEIGMTNVDYTDIEDFHDIWVKNYYESARHRLPYEEIVAYQRRTSRVNARTPMQWSDQRYAGFSQVEPQEKVVGNYRTINVEAQKADPDSILNYYRKIFQLRKSEQYKEIFVYGKFVLLDQDHPDVFAYQRTLENNKIFVISNFTDKQVSYPVSLGKVQEVISNTPTHQLKADVVLLGPYESIVLKKVE